MDRGVVAGTEALVADHEGGALLREKIVASASARLIVIADESKWVSALGHFPLPIEVVQFGLGATRRAIEAAVASAGCPGPALLRRTKDGHAFVTDGGHWILDAALELFVAKGYAATTIQAIAEQAGVAPQTVYAVFGNKPELLRQLIERTIAGGELRVDDQTVPVAQADQQLVPGLWSNLGDEAGGGVSSVMFDVTAGRIRHGRGYRH